VVGKKFEDLKVVIVGAGAAGLSIANMLLGIELTSTGCQKVAKVPKVKDLIIVDSKSAIHKGRTDLDRYKKCIAEHSNQSQKSGSLTEVVRGADVIIGVSKARIITSEMVRSMAPKAIVFAMANPEPEIMPELAKAAGAAVVATGRSDFENQINNVLAFPGVFRAVIDGRLPKITTIMKHTAAQAIAKMVSNPTVEKIIPEPFEPNLAKAVSEAILSVK
jgi:malate dehydrogenase (oxaloacetate-decarboxylating)